MSAQCDTTQIVTFVVSAVLRPESGLIPRWFKRGDNFCLVEKVTRLEDCGCPNLPLSARMKEVVYFRFEHDGRSYLASDKVATLGVNPTVRSTQDQFDDRIENLGGSSPSVNNRKDGVIANNWNKVVM